MIFNLEHLRREFDAGTLELGAGLVDSGLLMAPTVQRSGELVTCLVHHPGKRPFRVYVRVRQPSLQAVDIAGECTCHTGRNCRHIAAVLLKALDLERSTQDPEPEPQRAASSTSSMRTSRASAQTVPAQHAQRGIIYVLTPLDSASETLIVEIFSGWRLQAGGYAAITRYMLGSYAFRGVPPRFLEPQDVEILDGLSELEAGPRSISRRLSDPSAVRLLAAMLETGRCHFADSGAPALRHGPPAPAEIRWTLDEYGLQRLEPRLTNRTARLFWLSTFWYVDEENAECGAVQTGLEERALRQLAALSPVPPEDAAKTQKALQRRFPHADLLPLEQLPIDDMPHSRPVPCLRLISRTPARSEAGRIPGDGAVLQFDYGGPLLRPEGPATRLVGTRVLRARRDPAVERSCMARLLRHGFSRGTAPAGEPFSEWLTLPENPDAWALFQSQKLPQLLEDGWRVEIDENFRFRVLQPRQWFTEIDHEDGNDWFGVSVGVELEGRRLNLLRVLVELLRQFPEVLSRESLRELDEGRHLFVPLDEGGLLPLPFARLRHILETLFELYEEGSLDSEDKLRLNRFQLVRIAELEASEEARLCWLGARELRELSRRLRDRRGIEPAEIPEGLRAQLRPYQRSGLDWLQFLREAELSGILADDMGLGKTVQTLAHVLLEKQQGRLDRPAMVVSPTSLVTNWRREAVRFAPDLRVLTLHGPERQERFASIPENDLVLTTYPLLPRDQDALRAHAYHLLILDEAQQVKNPRSRAGQVIRTLDARQRLCLTGTPLENHLEELWVLFDFLLPGLLGTRRQFGRLYRNPIERGADGEIAERLAQRIRPFLLRRTKQAVAPELPEKTEIVRSVELDRPQRELYESIRLSVHQKVMQEIAAKGLARSQIAILDALLKLRQVCCDPRLVKLESAREVAASAKLGLLMDLLPEMLDEGRRILLFSQFTSMLGLIEEALAAGGLQYLKLTGQTRNRQPLIDRFQTGHVPLFLISLKAGGLGLNLTAADTVIHYDPWWNPAVERQATDRAHRIGQSGRVFVYKLICEGTVEERILALQDRKRALADAVYDRPDAAEPQWTEKTLEELLAPLG
jgi:SNF2 family DNA or RNA helicase